MYQTELCLFFRLELIVGTGSLLDSMLHDALFYRQSKSTLYQSCAPVKESEQPEFLPWTASDTRQGTRNCLMEQVRAVCSSQSRIEVRIDLLGSYASKCSYK